MPLSKLHVPKSLSAEKCERLTDELHASLVETCGVNQDDNFCLISHYSQQDMIIHPTFLGNRDPKSSIIVEIALLGGRTDEVKETFYKDFRVRMKEHGIEPNNIIIFLIENNPIDWSFSEAGSVKSVLGLK